MHALVVWNSVHGSSNFKKEKRLINSSFNYASSASWVAESPIFLNQKVGGKTQVMNFMHGWRCEGPSRIINIFTIRGINSLKNKTKNVIIPHVTFIHNESKINSRDKDQFMWEIMIRT